MFFCPCLTASPAADIDGLNDTPGNHVYQSLILGQVGPYIQLPSHSFLVNMGPHTALLLLDCRWEIFLLFSVPYVQSGFKG